MTNVSPRVGSPATTSPVQTPIRISSRSPNDFLELVVQGREAVAHLERGSQRPQRIVLVQDGSPEDGHHGVADELLDRAAMAFERCPHLVVVARHHAPHQLGSRTSPRRSSR